jgi:hypothetical protein
MPRSSYPARGRMSANVVLRTAGMVIGGGLIIVAVWLIVTSTTTKHQQIGVLVGLWGLLMTAFAAFGPRRHDTAADVPGSELALRPAPGGLGLLGDAEAVRTYEQQLRQLIRQEIQDAFRDELSGLRNEVAVLRSEVVDKVGGQLRLERIETTRVIGSDIEALQNEVRQLQMARRAEVEAARREAAMRETVDAEVIEMPEPPRPEPQPQAQQLQWNAPPQPVPVAQPEPVPVPRPQPLPVPQPEPMPIPQPEPMPIPQPEPMPIPQPEPIPVPQPEPPLQGEPAAHAAQGEEQYWPWSGRMGQDAEVVDPFASMPRIRPFTDFELEPVDPTGAPLPPGPPAGGRHAGSEDLPRRTGGRRRRDTDDEDDMLARILQRERGS